MDFLAVRLGHSDWGHDTLYSEAERVLYDKVIVFCLITLIDNNTIEIT